MRSKTRDSVGAQKICESLLEPRCGQLNKLTPTIILIFASAVAADVPPPRYPSRTDIPTWWQQTRGFYCPLENSGAGGSLMKFPVSKTDNFTGFNDLPNMLDDALRLGTNVIYLAHWWQLHYIHKGDYTPKEDWGGATALQAGVQAVHDRGG